MSNMLQLHSIRICQLLQIIKEYFQKSNLYHLICHAEVKKKIKFVSSYLSRRGQVGFPINHMVFV